MSLFIKDKVVLVKPYDKLKLVGNIYEIVNIINDSEFVLRDNKTKIAVVSVPISEFNLYFKKYEDAKGNWTDWNGIVDCDGNIIAWYKTNFKRVKLKINNYNICCQSSCNSKYDEFNLYYGIDLAYERCVIKFLKKRIDKAYCDIKKYVSQQAKHEDAISNILSAISNSKEG